MGRESRYREGANCPLCGAGGLVGVVQTERFEYKGVPLEIPDYRFWRCDACGEEFADPGTTRRHERALRDHQRRVDGLLTSAQIRDIRKSLSFSQVELGRLLGGGDKGFAKYETGRLIQSRAMDNLLRILARHPRALDAIGHERGDAVPVADEVRESLPPYEAEGTVDTEGVVFTGYRVRQLIFKVNEEVGKTAKESVKPDLELNYRKHENTLSLVFSVKLFGGKQPFELSLTSVGTFELAEANDDVDLDETIRVRCAARMYPLIRETVAEVTGRAGFPPLELPSVDFVQLYRQR